MEEQLEVVFFMQSGVQFSLGASSWSQQSEYDIGMRWSSACKGVSLEAEERPLLEAAAK
jgi:hypothetical protein